MKGTIKQLLKDIRRVVRDDLEDKLNAYMEYTLYGDAKEEQEVSKGYCIGTSQFETRVIGPCVTQIYVGQK